MGFRFRKSINLGLGFRINLSKSGIGYSWGVKGYRVTRTAKGTIRRTISLPGTGISYVSENGRRRTSSVQKPNSSSVNSNYYDTEEIVNSSADTLSSEGVEDILSAAKKVILIDFIANIGIILSVVWCFFNLYFSILLLAFIILKIYIRTAGRIDLDYTIDDDQMDIVLQQINPYIKITSSARVWREVQSNKVIDRKYTGGASESINRVQCKAVNKAVFPFKSNAAAASFKSGNETLIFLPDKLFVIQGMKIGALNYDDISTSTNTVSFIEREIVPSDTKIIKYTWQYVNKSGGPDKRFANNRKLPICQYGQMTLKSASGLNTIILFSNPDLI